MMEDFDNLRALYNNLDSEFEKRVKDRIGSEIGSEIPEDVLKRAMRWVDFVGWHHQDDIWLNDSIEKVEGIIKESLEFRSAKQDMDVDTVYRDIGETFSKEDCGRIVWGLREYGVNSWSWLTSSKYFDDFLQMLNSKYPLDYVLWFLTYKLGHIVKVGGRGQ